LTSKFLSSYSFFNKKMSKQKNKQKINN